MPGEVAGRASADVVQQMLDSYDGNIGSMPSVKTWKEDFFSVLKKDGTFEGVAQGGVEVHHAVEKYIQKYLGIPDELKDLCPGIPLPKNRDVLNEINSGFQEANQLRAIHRGMENGGISGILQSRIKKGQVSPNPDDIVAELEKGL